MAPSLPRANVLVVIAFASAVAAGCYKVDNPDFCCVNANECAAHGASGPVDCPAPLKCDAAKFTCYDPSNGGSCNVPQDCTSATTPYCVDHKCVQCMDSANGCTAEAPVCSASNACTSCAQEGDCTSYTSTPHCGASGACVACRDGNDCKMSGQPICDTGACRACASDTECPSNACDKETGACVDESTIIYLSPSGGTTGTCTKSAPCSTFALGIAQLGGARNVIKAAPGDYSGQFALSHVTATIYGDGATLTANATNLSVIAIGDGADVTIQGLHVTGAGGTAHPPGVACGTTTPPAMMRLHRMRIDANDGGGVKINACGFELINDVIVMNGGLASTFGGVLVQSTRAVDPGVLAFDTIVGNTGLAGSVTGVHCDTLGTPLTFDSDIVYDNIVSNGGKQVDSACSYTYSDINDSTNGTGNITSSPGFVNQGGGDYHLGAGSMAIDAADPASTLGIDLEGSKRPKGARRDIGAYESN